MLKCLRVTSSKVLHGSLEEMGLCRKMGCLCPEMHGNLLFPSSAVLESIGQNVAHAEDAWQGSGGGGGGGCHEGTPGHLPPSML